MRGIYYSWSWSSEPRNSYHPISSRMVGETWEPGACRFLSLKGVRAPELLRWTPKTFGFWSFGIANWPFPLQDVEKRGWWFWGTTLGSKGCVWLCSKISDVFHLVLPLKLRPKGAKTVKSAEASRRYATGASARQVHFVLQRGTLEDRYMTIDLVLLKFFLPFKAPLFFCPLLGFLSKS